MQPQGPHPPPRRRPRLSANCLVGTVFLAAFLGLLVSGACASAPPSDGELLCHTDNPAECYPKLFQPTTEFQKVYDDQNLPPGLHVRLNIWTGEKEAKINYPDEEIPALIGLPVDKAVVLVDSDHTEKSDGGPLPSGAPVYDPVGLVKAPGNEAPAFHDALSVLKNGTAGIRLSSLATPNETRLDGALENLMELSHDIYYGVKIAEDETAVAVLLCLMGTNGGGGAVTADRARQSASVLSSALQNNPAALAHVEQSWERLSQAQCSEGGNVASVVFGPFLDIGCGDDSCRQSGGALAKARLSAINGLLKSDTIKADFLASQCMTHILNLLAATSSAYHDAQAKAANLVMDNFLDKSMGATLGLWPRTKPAQAGECLTGQQALPEACWKSQVEKLAADHRDAEPHHWSVSMLALLQEQEEGKGAVGRAPPVREGRDEL